MLRQACKATFGAALALGFTTTVASAQTEFVAAQDAGVYYQIQPLHQAAAPAPANTQYTYVNNSGSGLTDLYSSYGYGQTTEPTNQPNAAATNYVTQYQPYTQQTTGAAYTNPYASLEQQGGTVNYYTAPQPQNTYVAPQPQNTYAAPQSQNTYAAPQTQSVGSYDAYVGYQQPQTQTTTQYGNYQGYQTAAPVASHYVQVAAFTRTQNAERLMNRLLAAGENAFITQANVNGRNYNRVRIPASSRTEARAALNRVRSLGYADARVVRR